jgi:hypothetical protein
MKAELYGRKLELLALERRTGSTRLKDLIDRRIALIDEVLVIEHKGGKQNMEKVKLALSTELGDIEDIAMRNSSVELEEEIKALADRIPPGKRIPLNERRAKYQTLLTRIKRMRDGGRIDPSFAVIRRANQVHLIHKKEASTNGKKALTK